jgi:hypothetical protein
MVQRVNGSTVVRQGMNPVRTTGRRVPMSTPYLVLVKYGDEYRLKEFENSAENNNLSVKRR